MDKIFQFLIKGYHIATDQDPFHYLFFQFLIKGYPKVSHYGVQVFPTFNSSLKDTYNQYAFTVSYSVAFQFLIKGYGEGKECLKLQDELSIPH